MATHQVRLKSRREIAEGTMAFHFEKPPGFAFKAGQALAWTLIDPPETDDEGVMRNFSIASAPGEADLMIATRMRDTAFKRVLKTMPLGTEVRIVGPFGSLTLHQSTARPAVFWPAASASRLSAACSGKQRNRSCVIIFFSFIPTAVPKMPLFWKSWKIWKKRTHITNSLGRWLRWPDQTGSGEAKQALSTRKCWLNTLAIWRRRFTTLPGLRKWSKPCKRR
jgi:Oxidoreductase FAD-binding domain